MNPYIVIAWLFCAAFSYYIGLRSGRTDRQFWKERADFWYQEAAKSRKDAMELLAQVLAVSDARKPSKNKREIEELERLYNKQQ